MSLKTNFFTLLENILDKFRGIFKTLPKVEDKDFSEVGENSILDVLLVECAPDISEKLETISSFSHQLVVYNRLYFEILKIKPI